eukprot:6185006-Pleurochrysis_carterae.AAC.1
MAEMCVHYGQMGRKVANSTNIAIGSGMRRDTITHRCNLKAALELAPHICNKKSALLSNQHTRDRSGAQPLR